MFPKNGQFCYSGAMSISGEELRFARRLANLTQQELADQIGVSKRTIVNWEREGGSVPEKSSKLVAEALSLEQTSWGEWMSNALVRGDGSSNLQVRLEPVPEVDVSEPGISIVYASPEAEQQDRKAAEQVAAAIGLGHRAARYAIDPMHIVNLL